MKTLLEQTIEDRKKLDFTMLDNLTYEDRNSMLCSLIRVIQLTGKATKRDLDKARKTALRYK